MANDTPWARDLGYLERFIQKLEGQAADLPDERRGKALAMLGAERSQWATIMALLAGGPVTADMTPAAGPRTVPAAVAQAAPAAVPLSAAATGGLTVGSLIGYP
ncbi:MAG: hypothetical protein H7338_10440 [Candidatus Sericytochromatia bacterium]|nr:hypothetical protein [Candidatus Sericytochromatia bacterium]